MTESREIEAIKEAQCNFLSFLWKHLIAISELEAEKKYYQAFERLCMLIRWMPEDFQNKFGFREKSKEMNEKLHEINSNDPVFHRRQMTTDQARNFAAKKALDNFVPDFAIMLDKKGYMERKGPHVEYGSE